jgi:hypothetical protein
MIFHAFGTYQADTVITAHHFSSFLPFFEASVTLWQFNIATESHHLQEEQITINHLSTDHFPVRKLLNTVTRGSPVATRH